MPLCLPRVMKGLWGVGRTLFPCNWNGIIQLAPILSTVENNGKDLGLSTLINGTVLFFFLYFKDEN